MEDELYDYFRVLRFQFW